MTRTPSPQRNSRLSFAIALVCFSGCGDDPATSGAVCSIAMGQNGNSLPEPGVTVCESSWMRCSDDHQYGYKCRNQADGSLVCDCAVDGRVQATLSPGKCIDPFSLSGVNAACTWDLQQVPGVQPPPEDADRCRPGLHYTSEGICSDTAPVPDSTPDAGPPERDNCAEGFGCGAVPTMTDSNNVRVQCDACAVDGGVVKNSLFGCCCTIYNGPVLPPDWQDGAFDCSHS
jgi:hypothetical protein